MANKPTGAREVKTNRRLVRVTRIGNGRYVALARLLPFLKVGDIVDIEAFIYDGNDWYVQMHPYRVEQEIRQVAVQRRTKGR